MAVYRFDLYGIYGWLSIRANLIDDSRWHSDRLTLDTDTRYSPVLTCGGLELLSGYLGYLETSSRAVALTWRLSALFSCLI